MKKKNNLKQNQSMKKVLCVIVAIAMVTALVSNTVEAAGKVKLNKKKVTLTITDSKKKPSTTLKIKGLSKKKAKKAKWYTSKKSVATVKKGKVTAKKAGKVTITCKVKGKKYKCRVTVVDKRTDNKRVLDAEVTIRKATDIEYYYPVKQYQAEDGFTCQVSTAKTLDGKPFNTWCASNLNKITVKYNGEDITSKAKFEIKDPYNAPYGDEATIDKDGTIQLKASKNDIRLTIVYKGMKKTLKLKTEWVTREDCVCRCGQIFSSGDEQLEHAKRIMAETGSDVDANGVHHTGYVSCEVAFIDVVYQ